MRKTTSEIYTEFVVKPDHIDTYDGFVKGVNAH